MNSFTVLVVIRIPHGTLSSLKGWPALAKYQALVCSGTAPLPLPTCSVWALPGSVILPNKMVLILFLKGLWTPGLSIPAATVLVRALDSTFFPPGLTWLNNYKLRVEAQKYVLNELIQKKICKYPTLSICPSQDWKLPPLRSQWIRTRKQGFNLLLKVRFIEFNIHSVSITLFSTILWALTNDQLGNHHHNQAISIIPKDSL